jgi:hypothetical protein
MTKQELLRLMRLLSALESVGIYRDAKTPDYLIDEIAEMVGILEREILK